jgi:hypothetical protein
LALLQKSKCLELASALLLISRSTAQKIAAKIGGNIKGIAAIMDDAAREILSSMAKEKNSMLIEPP